MPGSSVDRPRISVIVCTYNRADRLPAVFESFRRLEVPPALDWELIVVDNRSTDGTKAAVERASTYGGLPLRYVFEPMQGLGAARNGGLAAARGELIAFTDDDCYPSPDWLAAIAQIFDESDVAYVGGRVTLYDPRDLPVSIRLDAQACDVRSFDQVFSTVPGCNMAFRRAVIDRIGGFDPHLGAGLPLAAEDTDFLYRAQRAGLRIRFDPRMSVAHDHGRRTPEALARLNRSYVMGRGGLYAKHALAGDGSMLRAGYWELRSLLARALAGGDPAQRRSAWIDARLLLRGAARMTAQRLLLRRHRLPHAVPAAIPPSGSFPVAPVRGAAGAGPATASGRHEPTRERVRPPEALTPQREARRESCTPKPTSPT
jgi:GT2 family glycosyltransferase